MQSKQEIEHALKEAIRSQDRMKKSVLRMLLAAVKLKEVEIQGALNADQIQEVFQAEAKAYRETIEEATAASRDDLVRIAEDELAYLSQFMPEQLTVDELNDLARQAIAEAGVRELSNMGDVMKVLMPQVKGRADGKIVSSIVKKLLTPG